jgi:hypothetical protein
MQVKQSYWCHSLSVNGVAVVTVIILATVHRCTYVTDRGRWGAMRERRDMLCNPMGSFDRYGLMISTS